MDWFEALRENLQESQHCPIKYDGFPVKIPLNQSIDNNNKPMIDYMMIIPIIFQLW